jgi:hypothetical protein
LDFPSSNYRNAAASSSGRKDLGKNASNPIADNGSAWDAAGDGKEYALNVSLRALDVCHFPTIVATVCQISTKRGRISEEMWLLDR